MLPQEWDLKSHAFDPIPIRKHDLDGISINLFDV